MAKTGLLNGVNKLGWSHTFTFGSALVFLIFASGFACGQSPEDLKQDALPIGSDRIHQVWKSSEKIGADEIARVTEVGENQTHLTARTTTYGALGRRAQTDCFGPAVAPGEAPQLTCVTHAATMCHAEKDYLKAPGTFTKNAFFREFRSSQSDVIKFGSKLDRGGHINAADLSDSDKKAVTALMAAAIWGQTAPGDFNKVIDQDKEAISKNLTEVFKLGFFHRPGLDGSSKEALQKRLERMKDGTATDRDWEVALNLVEGCARRDFFPPKSSLRQAYPRTNSDVGPKGRTTR